MNTHPSVEVLESRIAPAGLNVVIVSQHKATYTDVDGDIVTVAVSSGTLTATLFTGVGGVPGGQLQTLDLSGGGFDHANLTITVKKAGGGDGLVNIGFINSTGHDLGDVSIQGDIGRIDAGDTVTDLGIKSLKVNSMGNLGTDTQDSDGGPNLESDILNGLGSLTVTHDITNAFIDVTGTSATTDGVIGPVKIGGSLIGGSADNSGEIQCQGSMGAVTIGGDIHGGSGAQTGMLSSGNGMGAVTVRGSLIGGASATNGQDGEILTVGAMGPVNIGHDVVFGAGSKSGYIQAQAANPSGIGGSIASVTIGGSLIGNSVSGGTVEADSSIGTVKIGGSIVGGLINAGTDIGNVTIGGSLIPGNILSSGVVSCGGNMGMVSIGHDIQGTSVLDSGLVLALGNIKGVHVGGSIIGGSGNIGVNVSQTGGIFAGGNLGPVTVTHNLVGGENGLTHNVVDTGMIEADGSIASVTIGGSIISGTNYGTGTMSRSGVILAGEDIGSVTVQGSIIGQPGVNAIIAADVNPTGTSNIAIGKITVVGSVENAQILGGYLATTPDNADAQIGAVKVGGNWFASSLVAGAENLGADGAAGGGDDNINFGDSNDAKITGGTDAAGVISKIASITIGGQVFGTPDSISNTDHFGFVAESFGSVKIGGTTISIPSSAGFTPIGETDDVAIHVIS